jgi:2,4'-dihydroxyacetophenone dioxygenase
MSTIPHAFMPARTARASEIPWVPGDGGKSSKPLRFLRNNAGFVELLRLEPGSGLALHRHSGEVHAYNLQGTRELCTGEIIGPGEYVYEPAGNIDWWRVVGKEPLIVLVTIFGDVNYLAQDHQVLCTINASTQLEAYHRHCQKHGITALDLCE